MSLVGAGFGRTGTLSLKSALETLGLTPCYHMLEVVRREGHPELWSAVVDGARDRWDEIFGNFQAAVDWPACAYWRELADHYPDAKVLLSVRDPDRWYDSVHDTIYQVMMRGIELGGAQANEQVAMSRKLVLEQTFGGRFEDRAHAISVFERHNQSVIDAIPADRLLVFEAKEGWAPLCRFLDRPVPAEPFPHVNTRDEMRAMVGIGESKGGARGPAPE
jgi:hypothetical protein